MATVEVNNMTFGKSYTAPTKHNHQVPNHLLETKIFSKVSENEIFQTIPSSIHFTGYEIKRTSKQILKLTNISSQCQRMHIIPPTTPYFKIKYSKKERLVPGFFMEIIVEFTPNDWQYYYDCIRIHCQSKENLVVPIHAYPTLNMSDFPNKINFGAVPVGESEVKTISLKSDIPVDFEFQLSLLQSTPAIKIEPKKGVISGCSTLDIKLSFVPTEFCTVHSKLQLLVSQFNALPQICHITGSSSPGLKLKLSGKTTGDIRQELEAAKRTAEALDPAIIDPLYRSRLKKMGKSQLLWVPPPDQKNEELVRNGIRFPKNLVTPSAVSYVLQQQPGKLKAKDIREAVKQKKDVSLSTKQMKETVFEYKVQQDALEERQNQLRWCVKLGQDAILDYEKNKYLEERALAEKEYKIQRGDPLADVEFDRSCTSCTQRRIHRQANVTPGYTARFDSFVNDDWTKRHRVLKSFIQAGRKVIIRLRVKRHLHSLNQYLSDWKEGKFTSGTRHPESANNKISTPFCIEPDMVSSFSFPVYKTAVEKEDGIPNSVGQLSVEATVIQVEPYIPYFKLKVPQQYSILGYKPHSSQLSAIGHVPRHAVRPLRSGAEDEIISLVSTLPHTRNSNVNILEIPTIDDTDERLSTVENATSEIQQLVQDSEAQREDVTTAGGKSRLVIPTVFFKQPKYHPLQIFNPSPGLHVLQPQVSYSKVDEDYHLCPLPRYKLVNKSGINKPDKPFIERPDVISGLMTWKRFPCQSLVSSGSTPNLTDVWLPRWSSPFIEDLLPQDTPDLLQELPEDDEMSDTASHDDDVTDSPGSPAVLSPEMVKAMFPQMNVAATHEDQRNERENELSMFVKTSNDRLGRLVRQRLQEMNSLLKDDNLKTTL